jgi:hypothetical protein
MYVFSIDIPFKGSQSLAKMMSKVTAVSYLHSGVDVSAVHAKHVIADFCHSGFNDSSVQVIDSAVTKIVDYKVDFLGEY